MARLVTLIVFLSGVAVFAAEKNGKSWQSKMSELSQALSEAIPFLYPDPEQDKKALAEKVKKIYEITKSLDVRFDHAQKVGDADPALPYIADLFKEDIERAYKGLQDGNTEYAKAVIRSSTAYCIACHTRVKGGTEFPLLEAFAKPLKGASWITKIEFEAASRQFDSVMKDVLAQLKKSGPTGGISSLDLERGARIALAIAIRVKRDPAKARKLAEAVAKSKAATEAMKEGAKIWLSDIAEWQKEKSTKYDSDSELMTAARSLIEKARGEGAPLGGHGEVKYLRATLLMHDLLKTYPKSEHTAEALYIVGLAYESLMDMGVWSLHEMYFKACIDKAPHTKLAEKCYKEYEDSVTMGYSGSRGVDIPPAVKKHLEKIKQEAAAP